MAKGSFVFERRLASVTAVLVVGVVLYLVLRNEPFSDPNLVVILRIVLAVSMGIVGATIPGFLAIDYTKGGLSIRAAGAFALALLCYFATPHVNSLNLSLPAPKVAIDIPFVVDVRTSAGSGAVLKSQLDADAVVTFAMSYRNTAQPAKTATLRDTEVELLIGPEGSRRQSFNWKYFVNMHDEQIGKWLAIESSASNRSIGAGDVLNLEILHQPNVSFSWAKFLSYFNAASEDTMVFKIRSKIDENVIEIACSVDLRIWKLAVKRHSESNGQAPSRVTMCCLENSATAREQACRSSA